MATTPKMATTMATTMAKGLPSARQAGHAAPNGARWNVLDEDLHLPLMVLKERALEKNIQAMARWCASHGFLLAPHGKTTMCPQIWKRQLAAGAWAITVANASQAMVCAEHGVRRILIANQLVGKANLRSVAALMAADPELDVYAFVDSVEGVHHLAGRLKQAGARPLAVLLEGGKKGWRTGVRTLAQGRAVSDAILERSGELRFAGFAGFEGSAVNDPERVAEFLAELVALADTIADGASDPLLFSIGGTAYLDLVRRTMLLVKGRFRPVIRSGCYVTCDHGIYSQALDQARGRDPAVPVFEPAIELWSYVQSLPDPGTAILTFGRRDCPYDAGLPIPLFVLGPGRSMNEARFLAGATITHLNDQHAFMSSSGTDALRVGDRVVCGISHPCTAFDKWTSIPVVDDGYDVVDHYRTFF
jgi:D-serine dehydratase